MIRRARKEDIPGINHLLAQVLLVHHNGRPDLFKEKGQKYTEEELENLIQKVEDPIFVYEGEKGEILAHCFCQTMEYEDRPSSYPYKTLYIDDLCVDEAFTKSLTLMTISRLEKSIIKTILCICRIWRMK